MRAAFSQALLKTFGFNRGLLEAVLKGWEPGDKNWQMRAAFSQVLLKTFHFNRGVLDAVLKGYELGDKNWQNTCRLPSGTPENFWF